MTKPIEVIVLAGRHTFAVVSRGDTVAINPVYITYCLQLTYGDVSTSGIWRVTMSDGTTFDIVDGEYTKLTKVKP